MGSDDDDGEIAMVRTSKTAPAKTPAPVNAGPVTVKTDLVSVTTTPLETTSATQLVATEPVPARKPSFKDRPKKAPATNGAASNGGFG
jgi:hypothetical protein